MARADGFEGGVEDGGGGLCGGATPVTALQMSVAAVEAILAATVVVA